MKSNKAILVWELNLAAPEVLKFVDNQTIIANAKDDKEYMVSKFIEEHNKYDLAVNIQEIGYVCVGAEYDDRNLEDNKGTDDKEM